MQLIEDGNGLDQIRVTPKRQSIAVIVDWLALLGDSYRAYRPAVGLTAWVVYVVGFFCQVIAGLAWFVGSISLGEVFGLFLFISGVAIVLMMLAVRHRQEQMLSTMLNFVHVAMNGCATCGRQRRQGDVWHCPHCLDHAMATMIHWLVSTIAIAVATVGGWMVMS